MTTPSTSATTPIMAETRFNSTKITKCLKAEQWQLCTMEGDHQTNSHCLRKDSWAKLTIFMTVEHIQPSITDATTSKEMWDHLQQIYEPQTAAQIAKLFQDLFNIKYQLVSKTMLQFVTKFDPKRPAKTTQNGRDHQINPNAVTTTSKAILMFNAGPIQKIRAKEKTFPETNTDHYYKNQSIFTEVTPIQMNLSVAEEKSSLKVEGMGKVNLNFHNNNQLTLTNVYYTPSCPMNLLSSTRLNKAGFSYKGGQDKLQVYCPNKKFLVKEKLIGNFYKLPAKQQERLENLQSKAINLERLAFEIENNKPRQPITKSMTKPKDAYQNSLSSTSTQSRIPVPINGQKSPKKSPVKIEITPVEEACTWDKTEVYSERDQQTYVYYYPSLDPNFRCACIQIENPSVVTLYS
ncbi:hypothetical protein CHUAL_009628 [Chamberlinius hualienensis]